MASSESKRFRERLNRAINHVFGNPFLKFLFPLLVIIGLILVATPVQLYEKWFSPRITGIGVLIDSIVILLPSFIFFPKADVDPIVAERQQKALTKLQNYIAIVVLLALSGALGLFGLYHYWNFLQYDKLLHAIDPFLLTVGLSEFIYHWYDISITRAVVIGASILMALNISWEFIEYFSDKFFGTIMFGQDGQNVVWDTSMDLLLDLASILTATFMVRKKVLKEI